jgi:hypothetical protein
MGAFSKHKRRAMQDGERRCEADEEHVEAFVQEHGGHRRSLGFCSDA